ncbi:c-type cytochrome [Paremcibacter congregatus]|uniref:c-type cytochrome n=1 Tax=Paremcibacter congregatus TaxID=2043170 RepID=UPI0030EC15EA|tara:strand:- start:4914 stop:5600 length:687 start_codon:yes stop_codon:yes gene_type:complete
MKRRYQFMLLGGVFLSLSACKEEEATPAPDPIIQQAANPDRGREHFDTCATCHGEDGQGNRDMGAPSLVNMAPWSVEAQLIKFRSGLRGRHADDAWGAQMADMAETLEDAQAITDVVAYIDSLPDEMPEQTLTGNSATGERYYHMICGACHGPGGQGTEAMQAPALIGVDDWYLQRQYQNFAAKIRGYHIEDKAGRQMGMMSHSLPGEQTLNDILVFLQAPETKVVPE